MPRTRHVFPTWEWGSPLGEDVLRHLVFLNPMGLFKVTEDVIHLLAYHLAAVLLVLHRCPQPPHVHTVGGVGGLAPLQVAPKVAIGISVGCQMVLHILQCHLQKETNGTDVSDDASDVHIGIGKSC